MYGPAEREIMYPVLSAFIKMANTGEKQQRLSAMYNLCDMAYSHPEEPKERRKALSDDVALMFTCLLD